MEPKASRQHRKRRKLSKRTQSPSTLPEELIIAILVRVPVKYLLQFKCISKNWRALISSPDFVKNHLNFSSKDYTRHISLLKSADNNMKYCSVGSLFHESVTEALDLDCPPMETPYRYVYISGSVNGLVCLSNGFNGLVLWNPSTRKFKNVLDFTPTHTRECWSTCGFGYDEVHDDYKVVGIFSSMFKAYFQATIYSLKSDSWKVLEDFKSGVHYCGSAEFVNGKLHWATACGAGWGIKSVDLVDEKWGEVELPFCEKGDFCLQLIVLGSDLSMLCHDNQTSHYDVWVMKEYGVKGSWTKLYTIRDPDDPKNYMLSPPLCISNKGEILFMSKSALAIYNPKNASITYPEVSNADDSMVAELCIESLVCPISQNEH